MFYSIYIFFYLNEIKFKTFSNNEYINDLIRSLFGGSIIIFISCWYILYIFFIRIFISTWVNEIFKICDFSMTFIPVLLTFIEKYYAWVASYTVTFA